MNFTLEVWRQKNGVDKGAFVRYEASEISPEMSFLEMLDVVNEGLEEGGEDPVAFDSDCREGICGMCSLVIDGQAHGPGSGTATCQIYMRSFKDGATIRIEPWRAKAFPPVRDLVVDRSAFDRIIQAGGYTSVNTGSAPDGNATLIPQPVAEAAMDAAACIGCGACVATCKNASAALFVGAKVKQLGVLPQGPTRAPAAGAGYARGDGAGGLWPLQQRVRVRGGLPQGDFGGAYCFSQPRVFKGGAEAAAGRRGLGFRMGLSGLIFPVYTFIDGGSCAV